MMWLEARRSEKEVLFEMDEQLKAEQQLRNMRQPQVAPTQMENSDLSEGFKGDCVSSFLDSGRSIDEQGGEDVFELLHEINKRLRIGMWVGYCFIYNNTSWRLNYCVGGELESTKRTGCWQKKNLVEIESEDDIKGDIGKAEISEGADSEIDRGENGFCDHVDRGESEIGIITADETKTKVNADVMDFVVENGCNEDVDAGESEMKNDIIGEMDIGVDVEAADSRVENCYFDHDDGAKSRTKTITEDGGESLNDMLLIGMTNRRICLMNLS
ncbi:hypothetical protein Drorol1_Dr00025235 [Drosera rotundifolia]